MSKQNEDLGYILNEKNKYITKEFIENLLRTFNIIIKIKNISIFQEAMNHLSYLVRDEKFYKNNKTKPYQIQSREIEPLDDIEKAIPLQASSYERLEFLGDAVIHLILAKYLFARYDNADEGFLTKLRTKIENGDTLSILAKSIGLNEYIVISRYVEKNGGRDKNDKILEDAFEAFIGALFLNIGFEVCKEFIIKLIERELDLAQLLYQETNFKEKLLQYFHIRRWLDPEYGTFDVSGPDNKKMYTMYVKCKKSQHDEGEIVGIGCLSQKKGGEQMAAKAALIHFGVYKEGTQDDDEECEVMSDDESMSDDETNSDKTDESISDYESDEEPQLICKKCKKEFKKEYTYKKHISLCKN